MIFLDANIVLELLLQRRKCAEVYNLLKINENVCISILTVHLVYYFGRKDGIIENKIDDFLESIIVLNSGQEVYDLAKIIRQGEDFEDALQIATAKHHKVNVFYTLDLDLIKNYNRIINVQTV